MSTPTDRLKELLAHYGADIGHWPEQDQAFGHAACEDPVLAVFIEQERRFEELLNLRSVNDAAPDFAHRIITMSYKRPQQGRTAALFMEMRQEARPAALAAMLVLGFLLGFGVMNPIPSTGSTTAQTMTDEEGDVL